MTGTQQELPVVRKLMRASDVWSLNPSLTEQLDEAAELITAYDEAASALIADVRRRYPGEELRCEYMRALDAVLTKARASGDEK